MMKQKLFSSIVLLCIIVGCTMYHIPSPLEPIGPIDDFLSSNTVSIVNVQDPNKEAIFLRCMGDKYVGNMRVWTDSAAEIAKSALVQRGIKVLDNAPRTLHLSVESAQGSIRGVSKRCETELRVETGSGYRQTYYGKYRGVLIWGCLEIFKAADYAVADAVTNMLNDEAIVDYLTQQ